jgi:hypothetical protein
MGHSISGRIYSTSFWSFGDHSHIRFDTKRQKGSNCSGIEEVPLHAEHPPKFPTRPLSGVAQLS